jgi:hypothetical protein
MPAWLHENKRIHLAETLASRYPQINFCLETPVDDVPLDYSQDIVGAAGLSSRTGADNQRRIIVLEFFVVPDTAAKLDEFRHC